MSASFQQLQNAFVTAIRNPDSIEFEDDDTKRRMAVYQSLFFNNVCNFLQTGFPVIHSILSQTQWQALARDFFINHQSRSPYFAEITKEFLHYLTSSPAILDSLPDFLSELAHYEWIELDVSIRKNPEWMMSDTLSGEAGSLHMSGLASLVSYTYPVHLIGPEYQPSSAPEERSYYVVYRKQNYKVKFVQVNPMTSLMLDVIEQHEEGVSLDALTDALLPSLPQFNHATLRAGAQQITQDMLSQEILVQVA